MENMKLCQSCAMPLTSETDCGIEKDGGISQDYCKYCYSEGKFLQDVSMDQMIEFCVPMVSKGNPYHSEEEARQAMTEFLPQLKRWQS